MTEPLGAPLDLEPHSPVVAARTDEALADLATLPAANLDGTTSG
jgi:myo-inositol-1(or 4)-monophosphatase